MISLKKTLLGITAVSTFAVSAKTATPQVEPPYWWAGMEDNSLQLMVNDAGIRDAVPSISYPGVAIDSVVRLDSPNYQFIYLNVSPDVKAGKFNIVFKSGKKTIKMPRFRRCDVFDNARQILQWQPC